MKIPPFTSAFLCAIAAVVLTGCSNSDTPKTPDVPTVPSTNAPAPAK